MRILILGSGGNLGQQLISIFNPDNEVIAWDKEQVDITDEELITRKIIEVKPSVIINAAAYNAVDKCEDSKEEFEIAKKINSYAPGYIAASASQVGAIFVHFSSDYVFDGSKKEGYIETDQPRPINKYGESKLLGEREVIKQSGKGLKWYIIRVSKLFGPKGQSELAKNNFFDIMLTLAKEKEELKVVDDEMSCFTYTVDLAQATKLIIDERLASGIYHVTNMAPCTWFEATEELLKQADINTKLTPVTPSEFPRPAKRPKYSVLLNKKIPQLRSYKEALRDYLNSIPFVN